MVIHPEIERALARERERDALAAAARHRVANPPRPDTPAVDAGREVTIRLATASDAVELWHLALLDAAKPLDGAILLAKVDGRLRAACALGDGRTIADPFHPTAASRRLLEVRREQLLGGRVGRAPRLRALRLVFR